MTPNDLKDRRVLVVEDELLIAIHVEEMLGQLGCIVVGPECELEAAMQRAREELLDAAVLDVTIFGGTVFPVAEILLGRGVPFVLASGYGDWALPEAFQGRPRLAKPFNVRELGDALSAAWDQSAPARGLPAQDAADRSAPA